jgi:hypothetical protein
MRTATATRTNTWHAWGRDSGGWGYTFGMKDMLATEHVHRVLLPSGETVGSRRIHNDCMAIDLGARAQYPDEITIEIMDRSEWCAGQRSAA